MGFFDRFKKNKKAESENKAVADGSPQEPKLTAHQIEDEKYIDREKGTIKIRGHNPYVPSGIIPVSRELLEDNSPIESSRIFSIRLRKNIPDAERAHRFYRMYAENIPRFHKAGNVLGTLTIVAILGLWVHELMKDYSRIFITSPNGIVTEVKGYVDVDDAIAASKKMTEIAAQNTAEDFKAPVKDLPIQMFGQENKLATAPVQGNDGAPVQIAAPISPPTLQAGSIPAMSVPASQP